MGSFDGWTYGEQMSPEATGTMTRFTTVLKLRPGRWVSDLDGIPTGRKRGPGIAVPSSALFRMPVAHCLEVN